MGDQTAMTSRTAHNPISMRGICRVLESIDREAYPVEVSWGRPKRTNKQSRYLFGVVYKTLADGMSEQYKAYVTPEMVHELCKQHFMPRIEVPGTGQSIPMSTTDLCRSGNEESFQTYVLQIQELAARKGIFIPDPGEETNGSR